jgi:hypothetical protein
MGCGGGTVFPEPSAFSLRHRFPTQCPFGSEASLFKLVFPAGQNVNRTAVMRQCARRPPGKMNKVTQPVLCVLQFRPVPQPFPIQVRVRFQDPRQRRRTARHRLSIPWPIFARRHRNGRTGSIRQALPTKASSFEEEEIRYSHAEIIDGRRPTEDHAEFPDRKRSSKTDQGESRLPAKMATGAARPAIRQSWCAGAISPRGLGAMDGESARWRDCAPTAGNPSEAGIGLTARPGSAFACCRYPNRLGY